MVIKRKIEVRASHTFRDFLGVQHELTKGVMYRLPFKSEQEYKAMLGLGKFGEPGILVVEKAPILSVAQVVEDFDEPTLEKVEEPEEVMVEEVIEVEEPEEVMVEEVEDLEFREHDEEGMKGELEEVIDWDEDKYQWPEDE